ncbi:MAG: hypothetical protein HOU01_20825, partial [Streptomycetaceae bacterium]|nr:hypothetical protein [Streptomycetaceae bacterium]
PIGGVIFEDTIDVPNGYCAPTVANTKPYTPSSTGCLGDPAAVYGDYGDTVTGSQLVLLESGETKDAATCSRVSRYESSFPANIITPGSAICFHSDSRQTVGAYEVVAVPDPNKPARYWKIKVTVWRAQPSAT